MPSDYAKNKGGAVPGIATSVRRCLGNRKFPPATVRKGFGLSGYKVVGSPRDSVAAVFWRPSDDAPEWTIAKNREELLAAYAEALESAGFVVTNQGESLSVRKPTKEDWTEVHHATTGELVGWHRPGEFWHLERGVPKDLEKP